MYVNYGFILGCSLGLFFVLICLFYEKSKVSIKEISLIAALSGLAGVSRVPFAGIPNVQATTFFVIISGYVFGPYHGFMVGFIATLVSNGFLGHGPWTPWQILSWGLAGLSAGFLSKFHTKPSRLLLSIFAFCWGFLFDYIMNLWHFLTFVYPYTLKNFIALYSLSFYFDLMHGLGNFIFVYFFGKDFITLLQRFKNRLSFIKE